MRTPAVLQLALPEAVRVAMAEPVRPSLPFSGLPPALLQELQFLVLESPLLVAAPAAETLVIAERMRGR
jgi:hypothetical protein